MNLYDYTPEDQADELAQKIVKRYKSYGIAIAIKDHNINILQDRFVYKIKLLPGTRKDDIEKFAEDVRMSLKLRLLQVVKKDTAIFVIAAKDLVMDNNLLRILGNPKFVEVVTNNKIQVPHVVGFDVIGNPVIADLLKYPHIMASGTTGSGKTVGLKCLLLSVIGGCSPNKARLLICDKANEFEDFSNIPHLSCPTITDSDTFLRVMLSLKNELDRRLSIKNSKVFPHLPALICVADEFLSFISEIGDKKRINLAVEVISAILRRGRHAKIHLILAAHNPTQKSMRIDLSDIPSRMAFRCAKFNNSITILGEGGAEKLRGNGDMLYRPASNAELQRIQGMFISPEETRAFLKQIRLNYAQRSQGEIARANLLNIKYGFVINKEDLSAAKVTEEYPPIVHSKSNNEIDNQLFAKIVIWALENESVSGNMICDTFHLGWKRANGFLEKLRELGIAGDMYAKLPRAILPRAIEDIPIETLGFLSKSGISTEDVAAAIQKRNPSQCDMPPA